MTPRVLFAVALSAFLVLIGTTPASAHAALTSSDPADVATVAADLERVNLTFSEAPLAGLEAGLRVEVRDDDGTDESSGAVTVEGTTMSKAVSLSPGPHTVVWRYVSPDGHPIEGQLAFTAEPAASQAVPPPTTSPTAAATPSADPTAAAAASNTGGGTHAHGHGGQTLLFGVVGILAVLVIGAVVLRIRRGADARTEG
ncbi:copper resistance protein CopC [Curtobacterium flaccumfaciens pv. flaccumfaciens]|uniref:copper resistance CopC family protein n=1 Tax=Curtobacterium flaccumfaciens TaxID=2035 RepID=UPI002658B8AD|nr:copper resistance protein CopC [Curtobacterium flaccumfaciens]MCS5510840.1 copper resistance protein CopC [Curtobacterium flaccumfaciens pv. flaccumfaciens]MCX2787077.1 copper resistance protein CopC [Curtobacterium flaccumfaciens pv. flaccumfaciens]